MISQLIGKDEDNKLRNFEYQFPASLADLKTVSNNLKKTHISIKTLQKEAFFGKE